MSAQTKLAGDISCFSYHGLQYWRVKTRKIHILNYELQDRYEAMSKTLINWEGLVAQTSNDYLVWQFIIPGDHYQRRITNSHCP